MKIDNKLVVAVLLAAVLLVGVAMNTQADSVSAKTAIAGCDDIIIGGEAPVIQDMFNEPAMIHTAEQKDLIITVSSINTIITDTKLRGDLGEEDSVVIKVKVLVDDVEAYPGEVTFQSRRQMIGGHLSDIIHEDGGIIALPEEVQLILNTTTANSFTFYAEDMSAGTHEIMAVVTIELSDGSDEYAPESIAGIIGPRTMIVNEVRLAN